MSGRVELNIGFDDFYRRNYRQVVDLAYALSGSRSAAPDLAQDAFLAVLRHWGTVATYDRPDAYVRRVAANLAISRSRRLAAEVRALARLRTTRPSEGISAPDRTADDFWDAVRRLPRRQAQTVALHYLEDRSTADIAAILGCAEATIKVHLHRARTTLAKQLGPTRKTSTL